MESRPPLTINISNLRSVHIASVGGLGILATVAIMAMAIPLAFVLLVGSALAGAMAAFIVIRMHREHVIGTPGDDLPMSLGLEASDRQPRHARPTSDTTRRGLPRLAVSY
jgi:hypothetical protein